MRRPADLVPPGPWWLLPLALLAACGGGEELSPAELAAKAERDVAMVRRANSAAPPVRQVTPEPILFPDIERHDMYGQSCNYAPGTSLSTRAIARAADAFVKVEGEVVRMAADPGAREMPSRTRSHYDGRGYSLRLAVSGDGQSAGEGSEAVDYQGTMTLYDSWGRVVYTGAGLVQCGA